MCDPVTAAGLALSAGGTFLQQRQEEKNARRAQQAKEGAFVENINRGKRFADEAGAFQKANTKKAGRENFDIEREAAADDMKQAFNDIRTQPDYNIGLPTSAPKNVVLARESASADATSKTDRDVENLSQLQGYGGALFNQDMDRSAFARLFGGIQDKAAANTRMLPLEMNAAATNSQKAGSLFPTLMRVGGQGLSLFGGAGGSFSNTVQGPVAAGAVGPGAPITSYGLFMDNKPLDLFGYKLAGRAN